MVIDIIAYTEEQLEGLSAKQMLEVRKAQKKKNALEAELVKEIAEQRQKLLENGTLYASTFAALSDKMRAECAQEVAQIRDDLLFYLHYVDKIEPDEGMETPPYPLDESLTGAERFAVVKQYYLDNYSDAALRLRVYKEDIVAREYLGDYYYTLYDVFLEMVETAT